MSFSAKVGSFAANTVTGNQAITGVGFQPTIVIFFHNHSTADGTSADNILGFGVGISSASRRSAAIYGKDADAGGGANVAQQTSTTRCFRLLNYSSVTVIAADFVSLDADGFTVNIVVTDGTAQIINYMALGGTDLSNVATGNAVAKASTGTLAVTGVGFQPDLVLFVTPNNSGTFPQDNVGGFATRACLGMMTASAQWYAAIVDRLASAPSSAGRVAKTSKCLAWFTAADGTLASEAAFSSMDADGFTLNWTTSSGLAESYYWIALKGMQVVLGSTTQPGATGAQAITTTGVAPSVVLLVSGNNVVSASMALNAGLSLGAGSSASARAHLWAGAQDNLGATTARKADLDRANILKMITAGSSPTVNAAADLTSLDSQGFTLNWSSVDATPREFLYLALGVTAAAVAATKAPPFSKDSQTTMPALLIR